MRSDYQRELAGFGLLALAFFGLLVLVPPGLISVAPPGWFPSGNLLGPVGRGFRDLAVALVGAGALAGPALLAVVGLWIGRWLEADRALRHGIMAGGLLLFLPPFLSVLPIAPVWGGWWGHSVAGPLIRGFGAFGAGLLLLVVLLLLLVSTVGLRSVAAPVRGTTRWGWGVVGTGARRLGDWLEGRRAAHSEGGAEGEADPDAVHGEKERPDQAPEPAMAPDSTSEPGTTSPTGSSTLRPALPPATTPEGLLPDPRDPRELAGEELPTLELLTPPKRRNMGEMERELDTLGRVLVEKLRTFNVESELAGRTTGPVVTQYEVVPAPGVKVNRIANLDADLALAMRARTIRIVAPIPGKGAVGVEIPNPSPRIVQLREVLESPAFARARGELPLALGMDLQGAPYVAELSKMPHVLIAGATGSGKSVCLNTVITSLVYRHTPETLRLLMIDPKMVELSTYGDLPHLRHPVVTDPKEAAGVLKWAVLEMERRYELLSRNGVRSIGEFNRKLRSGVTLRRVETDGEEGDPDRWIYQDGVLPNIVLVVDELADLMMTVQSEVEKPLTLLAQKARAIGIHLIVATQRPSVNVITGLIKANFPCRIAFRVASKTDSRTILDQNGADALLGNGDMLFLPPGQSSPVRVQGAFISTEDTERLMDWFRDLRARKLAEGEDAEPGRGATEDDILEVVRALEAEEAGAGEDDPFDGEWDEHFQDAAEICISNQQGSTSLLQRKLRVGYGRAARIVDQLHEAGVVGPPDGSKPREVLMTMEQLHRMMNGQDES
ncbi:MAG: DNA translocase FtsK [Gemmatimonadales bacterium]|nr:MAG: DNA translocase FtsK [Gemmatimonadales bacterium]